MNTLVQILYYLSFILAGLLVMQFIRHLYKNRLNKKLVLRSILGVLILGLLFYVPYKLIQEFASEPTCIPAEEVADYQEKGKDFDCIYYTISGSGPGALEKDSLNYERHFFDVEYYRANVESRTRHINKSKSSFFDEPRSQKRIRLYTSYLTSPDTNIQDLGNLFLALHSANLEQAPHLCQRYLSAIKNKDIPYFNYVQGLVSYRKLHWAHYDGSEQHLLSSIEKEECLGQSYSALGKLYWAFNEDEKLHDLVYNEETAKYLPPWLNRSVYFEDFNFAGYWGLLFQQEINSWHLSGVLAAAFLLFLWLYFLRKMDIYEPEKKINLLAVFLISIISMQLLYPMHNFLWDVIGYYRPSSPTEDLWYMIISIGMIEETVKILPVLLMLKFSKAINEPFDYILYASVSALGFAFMENIGYFDGGLHNISIRGFYCCIAHMAFSATIGYGLMLAKYRGYNKYGMFILFFMIASFLHGFYDFWLMDWWAIQYDWVSDLMVLFMIQLWILYASNTLNVSNFYDPKINFKAEKMKYLLMVVSILILMIGYVAIGLSWGPESALVYLQGNTVHLAFFMFFLVLSMSSMRVIRGYLAPIAMPLKNLLPLPKRLKDNSGGRIQMKPSRKFEIYAELLEHKFLLEQSGQLEKRLIIDDNLESYLIRLSYPIPVIDHLGDRLIAIPVWDDKKLIFSKRILIELYLIPDDSLLDQAFLKVEHFTLLGKIYSTAIPEDKD